MVTKAVNVDCTVLWIYYSNFRYKILKQSNANLIFKNLSITSQKEFIIDFRGNKDLKIFS